MTDSFFSWQVFLDDRVLGEEILTADTGVRTFSEKGLRISPDPK